MTYQQIGTGPAIVLLSGLGCDNRLWTALAAELQHRFTLLIPETWTCDTIAEAAEGVAGVMQEFGAASAGVAGLSMGGYVTFELLRRWPQKVRAAAILDSTPYPDPPERVEKRRQMLRLLSDGGFEPVLKAFAESVLSPRNAAQGPARGLLLTMARAVGAQTYARCVNAILERGSYEEVLRLVRVPMLFLVGEHDTLTPPEVARRAAAQIPGARTEVVPDAGHMTPLEAPGRVADLLGTFFGSFLPLGH